MRLHSLLAIKNPVLAKRIEDLLTGQECLCFRLAKGESLWERASAEIIDVLIAEKSELPTPIPDSVSTLRNLPEKPEVILIASEIDGDERAALLGSGVLAIIDADMPDETIRLELNAHLDRRKDQLSVVLRAEEPARESRFGDFITKSPAMRDLIRVAQRVASTDTNILLLGETGVGKEWLARAIHSEGTRSSGPFIAVNCGALPETLLESELFGHEEGAFTGASRARRGRFEIAHGGTIFLDEIGDMPLSLQVKLLRVLQERRIQRLGSESAITIDLRVMAATNRDPELEIERKQFRADLYYRLGVVTVTLPPLRQRKEDIPDLLSTYVSLYAEKLGRSIDRIHPDAVDALVEYPWPGNVRELINVVERAVLLGSGSEIRIEELPESISREADSRSHHVPSLAGNAEDLYSLPLLTATARVEANFEREYLRRLLEQTGGRIGATARRAGITTRTLYEKMKKHELKKEDFKEW